MQVNHNIILKRFFKINEETNQEILSNSLEAEQNLEFVENYYESIQGKKISREMRTKLAQWMILLCDDLKVGFKTKQSAIMLVDLVLSKMVVDKKYLQLLGITAIFIFIKCEESFQFTLSEAAYHCANAYSEENISLMETTILQILKWKLHYSTPGEIGRRLIYCFNCYFDLDLSRFFKKIDTYIDFCISENDFSDFSPNTIAITAIILAFEKDLEARNMFLKLIKQNITFDYLKIEFLYSCVMQEKNEYEPSQPGTDVGSDGAGNQNLNDETFDQGLAQSINSQTSISDSNGIYCEQVCDSQGQYVTPPMQQNKMNSSYLDSLQKTEKIFRDPKENTEMDEERYY